MSLQGIFKTQSCLKQSFSKSKSKISFFLTVCLTTVGFGISAPTMWWYGLLRCFSKRKSLFLTKKTLDWGRDTISSSWQHLWWDQKATWWMKNYLQPSISAMMNRKWCRRSLVFWKTHIFFSLKKSRHCRCGRCQCWKQNDQHNLPW